LREELFIKTVRVALTLEAEILQLKSGPMVQMPVVVQPPSPMKVNTMTTPDLLSHIMIPTVSEMGKTKAHDTTVSFHGDSTTYNSDEEEEALQCAMIESWTYTSALIDPASGSSKYMSTSQFHSLEEGHTSMEVSQLKGHKQGPFIGPPAAIQPFHGAVSVPRG
jgi:hypothetical protein